MKTKTMKYVTPYVEMYDIHVEGVLCQSGQSVLLPGGNENYGGVGEEEIF